MLFSAPKSFQPNDWLAENGCKGTKKWTKNQILFIFFVSNTNLHEFERRKPYSFHHNRFVTFILLLPVGWISFANLNKKVPFFSFTTNYLFFSPVVTVFSLWENLCFKPWNVRFAVWNVRFTIWNVYFKLWNVDLTTEEQLFSWNSNR